MFDEDVRKSSDFVTNGLGRTEICTILSKSRFISAMAGLLRIDSGSPPTARDQICSPRFMSVAVTSDHGGLFSGSAFDRRIGVAPRPSVGQSQSDLDWRAG